MSAPFAYAGCEIPRSRDASRALAQPQIRPQRCDASFGSVAWTKQPARVQPLQPLRVVDIALAAGHGPGLARIGDDDLAGATLQKLKHRYLVHPGGLHRDGLDADR